MVNVETWLTSYFNSILRCICDKIMMNRDQKRILKVPCTSSSMNPVSVGCFINFGRVSSKKATSHSSEYLLGVLFEDIQLLQKLPGSRSKIDQLEETFLYMDKQRANKQCKAAWKIFANFFKFIGSSWLGILRLPSTITSRVISGPGKA